MRRKYIPPHLRQKSNGSVKVSTRSANGDDNKAGKDVTEAGAKKSKGSGAAGRSLASLLATSASASAPRDGDGSAISGNDGSVDWEQTRRPPTGRR